MISTISFLKSKQKSEIQIDMISMIVCSKNEIDELIKSKKSLSKSVFSLFIN